MYFHSVTFKCFAESCLYKRGPISEESQSILTVMQLKFYFKKEVMVIPDVYVCMCTDIDIGIYKGHMTNQLSLILVWKDSCMHT